MFVCLYVCMFVCLLPMAGQTAGPKGLKFGIVTLTDPGSNMGGVKVGSKVKVTKAKVAKAKKQPFWLEGGRSQKIL
jgi:hypothetical protein